MACNDPSEDSEICGGAFGLVGLVHAFWTVGGRDVAEPALLLRRYSPRGFVGRDAADECAEVLDELVVDGFRRNADCTALVRDLPPELRFFCSVPAPWGRRTGRSSP